MKPVEQGHMFRWAFHCVPWYSNLVKTQEIPENVDEWGLMSKM